MISTFHSCNLLANRAVGLVSRRWQSVSMSSAARSAGSRSSLPHRRHMLKLSGGSGPNVNLTAQDEFCIKEEAAKLPLTCEEMDNNALMALSAMENHDARVEILKRHIMNADSVSYQEACDKFDEIESFNKEGLFLITLPYKLGIATSLTAGFMSIPLCFHLPSVHWFNKQFVTAEIPEPADLETWLEVGSWAWNWMEPPLGQISFFLLCLQFSRAQLQNLGIRPFTETMKQRRADRLVAAYPKYNSNVLTSYSESAGFYMSGFRLF